MQPQAASRMFRTEKFFFQKHRTHLLIVSLLFIVAFGFRAYNINQPPLDFHPTRQYRSAIIARGWLFETLQSVPDWQRRVATINKEGESILEPPIIEGIALLAYRITGAERLWVPRMFSVVFWLIGGAFLYALTRDLLSNDAALFSTAFYLFVPFSIPASKSFQPDPLMVCVFVASIFAISRYHTQPSMRRLAVATILSALGMFVKPMCLFAIFAAFISANVAREGFRKTLTTPPFFLFSATSLLPASVFYLGRVLIFGFPTDYMISFIPKLYFFTEFWVGWIHQINIVIGYIPLIVALIGVLLFPARLPKALILGLWIGYALFGLAFTYHSHTHDYYHLQLIPIAALSIAPIGALISRALAKACTQWYWRLALLAIFLFASLIYTLKVPRRLGSQDLHHVKVAQEIGEITQHSTDTIFLAYAYGKPLMYHGEISGGNWPIGPDFWADRFSGRRIPSAKERLDSIMMHSSPKYFIVTNLQEFESQQDLKQYLMESFPIVVQTQDYLIFDLMKRKQDTQ